MSLTPEQVNEFLSKAILESQIGAAVQASIDRVLGELKNSYRNPFDEVVRQHVNDAIDKCIKEHYLPHIRERVQAAVTATLTDDFMEKFVAAGLDKLRRSY